MCSGPVTAVKFVSQDIVASSSEDGSTKLWDLQSGQETVEAVPEGFTFPKQVGAQEKRINSYIVAAKGQTLCIFKTADKEETSETAETAETALVAFFQCASDIQAFDVSELERSHIAVGCTDGQVLQLREVVLLA